MAKLARKNFDLIVFLFFLLFSPLFFFNLGGYSLVDFDEAWWAEVARNILVRKDPFVLFFNEAPIFFHPPFGYSLIALSQLIFGVNEFASRLPSAILGFFSIYLTYLIGKELFNRFVGLSGSLMLVSSVWFILRARSGNLDTIFVFMFLLTIYLFIIACRKPRVLSVGTSARSDYILPSFIYLSAISFALLFMTKTFIGVGALAPMGVYYLTNFKKSASGLVHLIFAVLIALYVLSPWLGSNYLIYGSSFIRSLFENATKPGQQFIPNLFDIHNSLTLQYLHFGVREWYYPSIISLILSLFFIKKFPNVLTLYAWIIPLLAAFIITSKTEIWHLIPLYPAFGLLVGFFIYVFLKSSEKIIDKLKPLKMASKRLKFIGVSLASIAVLSLGIKQIYEFRNEINLFDHYTTGLAYTAKAAQNHQGELYLDNDNFLPSTVFYSQKKVILIRALKPPINILKDFVDFGPRPSLLITEKWRLDADQVDPSKYQVVSSHQGYVLIRLP